MDDDVVGLLALDAVARGQIAVGALNISQWASAVASPTALLEEHWLLAYEANLKGWLNAPSVAVDPFFSVLHAANVSFYDATTVPVGFTAAAFAAPGGTLDLNYI